MPYRAAIVRPLVAHSPDKWARDTCAKMLKDGCDHGAIINYLAAYGLGLSQAQLLVIRMTREVTKQDAANA